MFHESELDRLRHQVRFLEILHKECKLKAQRMALQSAYYERLYKQAAKKEADHEAALCP